VIIIFLARIIARTLWKLFRGAFRQGREILAPSKAA